VLEPNFKRKYRTVMNEYGTILDRFENETDRAVAILAVCLLDDQLKAVIQAFYVKDPEVESLFKDDHILQTFNSKVNIAYFSGLIPKPLCHDLKLVGKIRNRFAHTLDVDLRFSHPSIDRLIRGSTVGSFPLDELSVPRSRFTFIVAIMTGVLPLVEQYCTWAFRITC
jgi:hypothetical protein